MHDGHKFWVRKSHVLGFYETKSLWIWRDCTHHASTPKQWAIQALSHSITNALAKHLRRNLSKAERLLLGKNKKRKPKINFTAPAFYTPTARPVLPPRTEDTPDTPVDDIFTLTSQNVSEESTDSDPATFPFDIYHVA